MARIATSRDTGMIYGGLFKWLINALTGNQFQFIFYSFCGPKISITATEILFLLAVSFQHYFLSASGSGITWFNKLTLKLFVLCAQQKVIFGAFVDYHFFGLVNWQKFFIFSDCQS